MVDLLRYLRDRGVIVQDDGRWALVRAVPDLQRELPESVRGMIQRKVDQLSTSDRHLLMAASVQGPEFDSAVVAQLLGREAADVEERLDVLEHVHFMVRLVREQTFPDGTLTLRYGFVHVLYQNALYAALQPTRKAAWSAAAARALLGHHRGEEHGPGRRTGDAFRGGAITSVPPTIIWWRRRTLPVSSPTTRRWRWRRRGLALLEIAAGHPRPRTPRTPLANDPGYAVAGRPGLRGPGSGADLRPRPRLCEQMQEAPPLFPVLWGLWMYYEVRGESREIAGVGRAALHAGPEGPGSGPAPPGPPGAGGHVPLPRRPSRHARTHGARGCPVRPQATPQPRLPATGRTPEWACLAFGAVALWLLGYPRPGGRTQPRGDRPRPGVAPPSTLALALHFAAILGQYRRDGPAVQESAEATTAIATEHGFSFWQAIGLIMRGWALAEQGAGASGIAQLRQGLTAYLATGGRTVPDLLPRPAGRSPGQGGADRGRSGRAGRSSGPDGRARVRLSTGPSCIASRASSCCGKRRPKASCREAEACFRRALTIARGQQAKSLELRATMSLTRLYQNQNRTGRSPADARRVLRLVHRRIRYP